MRAAVSSGWVRGYSVRSPRARSGDQSRSPSASNGLVSSTTIFVTVSGVLSEAENKRQRDADHLPQACVGVGKAAVTDWFGDMVEAQPGGLRGGEEIGGPVYVP